MCTSTFTVLYQALTLSNQKRLRASPKRASMQWQSGSLAFSLSLSQPIELQPNSKHKQGAGSTLVPESALHKQALSRSFHGDQPCECRLSKRSSCFDLWLIPANRYGISKAEQLTKVVGNSVRRLGEASELLKNYLLELDLFVHSSCTYPYRFKI